MFRTLRSIVLAAVVALPAVSAFAADGDKCTIATKPETDVGKACASGGVKAAKKVMKQMTKDAKSKGLKMDCDTCHKNDTTYELTSDAKQQMEKMVAAIGKK